MSDTATKAPPTATGRSISEARIQLGQFIKDRRSELSMSQSDLSGRVGSVHYTNISDVERGKGRVPSNRTLQWAVALRLDPEDWGKRLLRAYEPEIYSCIFELGGSRE